MYEEDDGFILDVNNLELTDDVESQLKLETK